MTPLAGMGLRLFLQLAYSMNPFKENGCAGLGYLMFIHILVYSHFKNHKYDCAHSNTMYYANM